LFTEPHFSRFEDIGLSPFLKRILLHDKDDKMGGGLDLCPRSIEKIICPRRLFQKDKFEIKFFIKFVGIEYDSKNADFEDSF
jgi:hypothetical protein